jgi:hypothetical protein
VRNNLEGASIRASIRARHLSVLGVGPPLWAQHPRLADFKPNFLQNSHYELIDLSLLRDPQVAIPHFT